MTASPPDLPKLPGLQPLHVVILYLFAVFAAGYVWLVGVEAGYFRAIPEFQMLFVRSGAIVLGIAMLSWSPELRAAIAAGFARPTETPRLSDMALALAVAWCYCAGVHRLFVVMPLVMADAEYFHAYWRLDLWTGFQHPALWFGLTAAAVLPVPILEELFFRGLLLNAWRAKRSLLAAVFLSSAVFGLTHLHTAFLAFGLGVVLALVYVRYRSLWPAIAIHALYNLVLSIPAVARWRSKDLPQAATWEAWTFEIALSIAFIPLAIVFWRRFKPA
jgi:membrane protease YdiL (CAAX protease family)